MTEFFSQLVIDANHDGDRQYSSFWTDDYLSAFNCNTSNPTQNLNSLVFKICRNPHDLHAHIQRIFYCYNQSLSDQLYAALLDLFIILDNKGRSLALRMLYSSMRQLNAQQFWILHNFSHKAVNQNANGYTLFTHGFIGKKQILTEQKIISLEHDFLKLANDFIEYSQLEQAMDMLETGIDISPEREDLQLALLELYQSTHNHERFLSRYENYITSGVPLIEDWYLAAKTLQNHP